MKKNSFFEMAFQSLLYWIGYSNIEVTHDTLLFLVVSILVVLDWVFKRGCGVGINMFCVSFNPCCIGLGIQTRDAGKVSLAELLFQSLLYWIGYSNRQHMMEKSSSWIGFNPCCIGLGIQTTTISL